MMTDLEWWTWVLVGVALGSMLILGVSQWLGKRKTISSSKGVVYPPEYGEGVWPMVTNLVAFSANPLAMVRRGQEKLGDVFTIRLGPRRMTFMLGPGPTEVMFRSTDAQMDSSEPYSFSVPVFGRNVVYDSPLEERYQHFRIFSGGLRADKLKSYVPKMVEEATMYFDKTWNDPSGTGEVDLLDSLSELIVLTASRCLLGREVRENLFVSVNNLLHDLDMGMQPISILAPYLPIPAHRLRDRARKEISAIFRGVLENRRAKGVKEEDLLQVFIDARMRDGKPLTDDQIVGLLIAAIFGGQHTSAITSTWTGLHLIRDQQVLSKVILEQRNIQEEFGEELNFEALLKMDLIHVCMKETLRMYPPLVFLLRKVLEPREVGKYTIPVNDYAVVSPQISGRMSTVFPDPEKWDPSRFLSPRSEDKLMPFAFFGFGGGRHSCLGEQFAYLQVKTIWSHLLRNFVIEPVGELSTPNFNGMVVFPNHPCRVRYTRKKL
uniref:Uncharacterized protein n=1 Tax=Compsopogon caeruleus TaxID=31354 RepID=A0A7S1T5V4_9RHOD|mmetsp:Transcript_10568/g.21273  ORF Transcript_10568/g.21273 Transcript_10568/m.21273 type:complete len:491 (+) Transcript_10568:51-1523(+)